MSTSKSESDTEKPHVQFDVEETKGSPTPKKRTLLIVAGKSDNQRSGHLTLILHEIRIAHSSKM